MDQKHQRRKARASQDVGMSGIVTEAEVPIDDQLEDSSEDKVADNEKHIADDEEMVLMHGLASVPGTPDDEGDEEKRSTAASASAKRPFRISFVGVSESQSTALLAALTTRLAPVKVVGVSPTTGASLLIRGFDENFDFNLVRQEIEQLPPDNAKHRIFLEPRGIVLNDPKRLEADNRAIAKLAAARNASLLSTCSLFARYDDSQIFHGEELSEFGAAVLAHAVHKIAIRRHIRPDLPPPNFDAMPTDVTEARTLAESPLDLLSKLSWDFALPPRLIGVRIQRPVIAGFVESRIVLMGRDQPIPFDAKPDWSIDLANEREAAAFLGLEFLTPVLTYWYAKANGRTGDEIIALDNFLKEKGVTASSLLSRTGSIIADFVANCPSTAFPKAWQQVALAFRARALLMFLLCCRSAAKRRIRFDGQLCRSAFCGLIDVLETLRSNGQIQLGSEDDIRQLSFLVGVALPLRRMNYGKLLLQECFARLDQEQLAVGVSEDGVWHGGTFEDHCAVLRLLTTLLSNVRAIKLPAAAPVRAVAEKMGVFLDAMLRYGYLPPPIDHIPLVSHEKLARAVRDAVPLRAESPSDTELTHFFPEGGYFISHSKEIPGATSSQLVVHTSKGSSRRKRLGRMTLGFSIGATELIIGGGSVSRKASKEVLEASRTDLASGNEYRVDGKSYSPADSAAAQALAIERNWRGQGWAAAMIVNRAHGNAVIIRTVLHLKPIHVLIVVDELKTKDGETAEFEQFWHIAPKFALSGGHLQFSSEGDFLLVAVDAIDQAPAAIETGNAASPIGWTLDKSMEPIPNSYLRRRKRLTHGLSVSMFRWTNEPASLDVRDAKLEGNGWIVSATGKGFGVRFAMKDFELRRVDRLEG